MKVIKFRNVAYNVFDCKTSVPHNSHARAILVLRVCTNIANDESYLIGPSSIDFMQLVLILRDLESRKMFDLPHTSAWCDDNLVKLCETSCFEVYCANMISTACSGLNRGMSGSSEFYLCFYSNMCLHFHLSETTIHRCIEGKLFLGVASLCLQMCRLISTNKRCEQNIVANQNKMGKMQCF